VSTDKIRFRADADMVSPMEAVAGVVVAKLDLESVLKNVNSLSASDALSELGVRAGNIPSVGASLVTE
jgi:hypothetical protein